MNKDKTNRTASPMPAKPKDAKPKDAKAEERRKVTTNPPFTTKHGITSPKFGSAGSGGAENDPGPEAD